jgi:hypothetical protein
VAVAGKFALGDLLGPFRSVTDAEDKGITAAYDSTNSVLAHQHVVDFYAGAGNGTELYVVVLANTVTMAQITDKTGTYTPTHLAALAGKVRMVCVTRIPNAVGTLLDQFPADLFTAITNAQALRVQEFDEPRHRPVQFILEGHNFQGTVSSMGDCRTKAANHVTVVISQDRDIAASNAAYNKYANAAYAMGVFAGSPVQRNAGRVKSGKLKVANAGLSNGVDISTISDTNINTINDLGYMFMLKHSGLDGYFFNDSPTCAALTDDYAYVTEGRVMDKASRIARQVYLNELLDDVEIDPQTGKLDISVIKTFQSIIETAIASQMKDEISGVSCYVDPTQNVQSTSKIETEVTITKRGTSRRIVSTLSFSTLN